MPSPRYQWLRQQVHQLYARNRQRGFAPWANREYDFVCPSTGTYPFQWFWDSCFHAVALSHLDLERAKSEVRGLLANQQPDGFIGHVTFWQRERYEELLSTYAIAYRTPYLSDCIQPPLLAEAVDAVMQRGGDEAFLREVVPKLTRYYDWLDRVRDPDRDGLIAVVQADETGLDHSPKWDRLFQVRAFTVEAFTEAWERVVAPSRLHGRDPRKTFEEDVFIVEDVMVNTIYAENQRLLSQMHHRLGDGPQAERFARRARATRQALIDKCWDERTGLFYDLAGHRAEEPLRVNTFSCLMPLLLPELPSAIAGRLIAHLEDPRQYAAAFPVPSVSMDEPTFQPGVVGTKLVWRGPTWMNSNWYLARGLRAHGHTTLARTLEDRSVQLIERSGFREYYNPRTAEGHGALDFSWSALALDLLSSLESN